MSGRLIYVVGPSGAGKDSLLQWAKQRVAEDERVHFARRTITRQANADAEQHEAVDHTTFAQLLTGHAFAMHWFANGLSYGIRSSELIRLADGWTVVVNGSREYTAAATKSFPTLTLAHVTASEATLRARLAARGREDAAALEARIQRGTSHILASVTSDRTFVIRNEGLLEEAGMQLLRALRASGVQAL